jgi:hypothetical protein
LGGPDESWAIDNLEISINASTAVPEPSFALLLVVDLGAVCLIEWKLKAQSIAKNIVSVYMSRSQGRPFCL